MASIDDTGDAQGRAESAANTAPPRRWPKRVRCTLATIDDVRLELARLYREARAQKIPVQDASRLANILMILGRLIEGATLEARIEAVEAAQQQRGEAQSWRALPN